METIIDVVLWVTFIKSITIGSEFNFFYWIRDGGKYTDWYMKRQKYCGY